MNRQLFSPPVLIIALIAVLVVGSQTVFTVAQWEQALIIQLGQFKRAVHEPGMHWKIPFVQQLHKLEKRILSSDSESSEYLTLDRKRVLVNHVTR
jgi:modulator of FtsH protease HflC